MGFFTQQTTSGKSVGLAEFYYWAGVICKLFTKLCELLKACLFIVSMEPPVPIRDCFFVSRQIFLRHLLNCFKLLQLNLHLLASAIIHHQEQYMPLTWCLNGTPAEMVRSSFLWICWILYIHGPLKKCVSSLWIFTSLQAVRVVCSVPSTHTKVCLELPISGVSSNDREVVHCVWLSFSFPCDPATVILCF